MEYQKAMLEDLMSQYVDVDNKDFWDDSVCKHYLVAFCPSRLFTNTKSDLGACDKIHNDRLKDKYQKVADKSRYPYEDDFYDYLNQLVSDLARKIRLGHGRLNVQSEDKAAEARKEEREEKMVLLDETIKKLLQKVEEAGEEGHVKEATALQSEVDKLQGELNQLKEEAATKNDKRMEVCEVCGAFLVTHDSTDRLGAHIKGKQHQGYLQVRETINQMKQNRQQKAQSSYSRPRHDYHERRDGGRHREYSRHSDRGYRDSKSDHHRSRDRRDVDDDFTGEIDRYSKRSRRSYDRSRSRSPVRRSRY